MPSVIESPSGRLPEKAPRWDLMGTEASDDGKYFRGSFWYWGNVWEFIGRRIGLGDLLGGHKPGGAPPRARPAGLSPLGRSPAFISKSSRFLLVQEKSSRRFYSVWTPFDIPYLQYSKTRKKQKLALGTRLIG